MKINLTDDESYQIQNDIKEKRNRKVEVREEGNLILLYVKDINN